MLKPVTHCWCQGALLPLCWGSGSCGGASRIFREGGIPAFLVGQGAARPHRGHCPTPSAFGSCLDLPVPMENHLEPLVIVRETKPLPETPRGRSGELPINSFPFNSCPGPAAPLGAVDGRTRPEEWGLVSPQHLVPGFGDVL